MIAQSHSSSPPTTKDFSTHPGDSFGFETSFEESALKVTSSMKTKSRNTVEGLSSETKGDKVKWAKPFSNHKVEHIRQLELNDLEFGSDVTTGKDYTLPPHPFGDDPNEYEDLNPHLVSVPVVHLEGLVESRKYDDNGHYVGSIWENGFNRMVPLSVNYNPSTRPLYGSPKEILFDSSDAISELAIPAAFNKVNSDAGSEFMLEDEMTVGNEDKDQCVLHLRELREATYAAQRYVSMSVTPISPSADARRQSKSDKSSEHGHSDASNPKAGIETMYQLAAVPRAVTVSHPCKIIPGADLRQANIDLTKPDHEIWHQGQPAASPKFKHHRLAVAEWRHNPLQEHWERLDIPKPFWLLEKWWFQGWEKVGLVQYV